jgi:hypothetical protein
MIVVSREKQCATVQKLGLNIRKLEEATMGSMSNWFNDKEHPENAAKQVFLEEIFKVAKAEERYNNGEIGIIPPFCAIRSKGLPGLVDSTTCIPEIHSDKNRFDGSDIAESDEVIKEDDEGHEAMPFPVTIPTPDSRGLPTTMVQNQPLQQPDSRDFYKVPTIPVSHYSQPQLEDHDLYGHASYPSSAFQTQNPSPISPIPEYLRFNKPIAASWESSLRELVSLHNSFYLFHMRHLEH